MDTVNMETVVRLFGGRPHVRGIIRDRRVSQGRRSMIRFDETGGDRRSGYARRETDLGFRQQFNESQGSSE